MNSFIQLTKAFFLSGFNVNKKKQNQRSAFKALLIFGIVLFVVSFLYNALYMKISTETGLALEDYMLIVLVVDALIVFTTCIFQMQQTIFKTKDYEFLESLPVKKSIIVSAKIFAVYLIGLFEDLLITIPAIILYLVFVGTGYAMYYALIIFISTIFVSIVPILFSSIISTIIALITARMKNQSLFSIILYLVFFAGIFTFSFMFGSSTGSGNSNQITKIINILPHFKLVALAQDMSKWYMFLIFIAIHIVSYALVAFFIGLVYRPMNTFLGNYKIHEEYKSSKNVSNLSVSKTLLKKDLNMIFKKSQYALNAFLGPIMGLMMGIFFILMPSFMGNEFESASAEELQQMVAIFMAMIPALMMLFNSMSSSTSASISLEGQYIYMLASYPITGKDIIKAKMKAGLLVPIVVNLIAGITLSIIISVMYGFYLELIFQLMIIPSLVTLLTSIVGMLCGLRWAKFDFQNEMQVLKNSACVSFPLLFVTVPMLMMMGLTITLNIMFAGYFVAFGVDVLILSIAIIITYNALKKNSESMFRKALTR